jgi:NAD(P)-dependent dehydrogenase (short-subunit alcohol dehydrogenase family)
VPATAIDAAILGNLVSTDRKEPPMDLRLTNKKALVTGSTAGIGLARGLAEATAGTAVTVNSVLPGPTRSEGVERFVEDLAKGQGTDAAMVEAEFFRTARPSSLLRRFATPEEVAAMVVYVCSPRASATNGAALRVDGGVVRSIV